MEAMHVKASLRESMVPLAIAKLKGSTAASRWVTTVVTKQNTPFVLLFQRVFNHFLTKPSTAAKRV
jgi:hypothetical protein